MGFSQPGKEQGLPRFSVNMRSIIPYRQVQCAVYFLEVDAKFTLVMSRQRRHGVTG